MVDSQLRAARIAAVAAIVAAVISATSGVSTYAVSQNQITADDKRSATEFQRTKRQEAVAAFMVEHLALRVREEEYYFAYVAMDDSGSENDVARHNEASQAVYDGFEKFDVACAALKVVASADLGRVADDMRSLHVDVRDSSKIRTMPVNAPQAGPAFESLVELDDLDEDEFLPMAATDILGD